MKLSSLIIKPPKIILAGSHGTGKTALLTTLGSDVQILDLDQGLRTALTYKDSFSDQRSQIDYIPCYDTNPTVKADAYRIFKEELLKILNKCNAKTYPFKVLGIDSFTTMCDACQRYILGNANKLNITKPGEGMTTPEWGVYINEIEGAVQIIKAMPIPVILLAHTIFEGGETIGGVTTARTIELAIPTKKLPPRIPTHFDEVWYAKVKDLGGGKTSFCIQTKRDTLFAARTRCNIGTDIDMNLGMRKILSMLGYDLDLIKTQAV